MKRGHARTLLPLSLLLLFALPLRAEAAPGPLGETRAPAVQNYADLEMANQFLSALSGGAVSLPGVDELHVGVMLRELLSGNYEQAAEHGISYLVGKGIAFAGTSPAAAWAAVSLAKSLSMKAHDTFGGGKLDIVYGRMTNHTTKESWPRSYDVMEKNPFIHEHFLKNQGPIITWLKIHDVGWKGFWGTKDPTKTLDWYARKAWDLLVAQRDFDVACERLGLTGDDRTPEKLEAALQEEFGRDAAQARDARDETIARIETSRKLAEARAEKARLEEAKRAEAAAQAARAEEERARLEKERRRLEATARALEQEAVAAEKALAAQLPNEDKPAAAPGRAGWPFSPPGSAPTGALEITALDADRTGPDTTVFRATITNTGSAPVVAFQPLVRSLKVPASGGVAWSSSNGPRTLAPGARVEVVFTAAGDVGAVLFYLLGEGEVLLSRTLPVDHALPSPSAEPPPPEDDVDAEDGPVTLPARFEGRLDHRNTSRVAGQERTVVYSRDVSLDVDREGAIRITFAAYEGKGLYWGCDGPLVFNETRRSHKARTMEFRLQAGDVKDGVVHGATLRSRVGPWIRRMIAAASNDAILIRSTTSKEHPAKGACPLSTTENTVSGVLRRR